jgi:hypothetical protein
MTGTANKVVMKSLISPPAAASHPVPMAYAA